MGWTVFPTRRFQMERIMLLNGWSILRDQIFNYDEFIHLYKAKTIMLL